MEKDDRPRLEKLTWKQARSEVMKANPQLALEIDKLDPSDEYLLIKARYAFGDTLLDKGVLYLPNEEGQLLSINDSKLDVEIINALSYARTIPLGIVLNNSIELFLIEGKRVIPFSLMQAGKIFSLWGVLEVTESAHYGKIWSITAGARSLMMLPKISDMAYYKKLRHEFGLSSMIPKGFLDEWEVFRELANCPIFPEPWDVEVIFFSQKWLENREAPKWRIFRGYLIETGWHGTSYLRNQVIIDFAFSCALGSKNLKPNPYLTDTIKHLYSIGTGTYPGFVVADDNVSGPIRSLQRIFNDIYNLRYAPTMLRPGYITIDDPSKPCYYSLGVPTLMVFSPKSRKFASKLEDLREIKHIMSAINSYLLADELKLVNTPIYKWAKHVNYFYYHSEAYTKELVLNSMEIVANDSRLASELKKYPNKSFCSSSPFLRGCISVSSKF